MAEWTITTLEACTDILGDGLHGTPIYSENGEYAFVNGNNLVDGEILIKKDTKKVDESQYEKYKKSLSNRTILVSINGTLGNVGTYNSEKIILGKSACYFNVKNSVDKGFIYYVVSSPAFRQYLESNATGTTIKNISLKQMREYSFAMPSYDEQQRISSILKIIDRKIKGNKEINKNLEQQAQAIFLKMFPDIFSASASSSFQNLIEFSNGKKRPETIGNIPVYGGNGVLAYTNQSNAENCVIIGRVGAYCGNTFLCPEKCWTSDNAIQAKSKNEDSPLFIYYLLRNASLPSRHIGTGQPLMTQAILNAIPVNEPSTQEIRSFINICTPLHETIFANEKQNISLALLRDTLLPKLMSGELDVSDIDL